MKRLIKANEDFNESITDRLYRKINREEWEEKDLELHKSIDWKERNYSDYPVPEDSFDSDVVMYDNDGSHYKTVKFIKYLRSNPIFPPYYAPEKLPFPNVVGPMYDGDTRGKYKIHNRYETQSIYDALSR